MTGDMTDLKSLIGKAATGAALTEAEAEVAFGVMMSGDATPAQMGGFLMALRVRGETVDEITGAARTMRAKATTIEAPPPLSSSISSQENTEPYNPIVF